MKANWLKARQTKFTAYATLYILVILGVVILVNWLADRHNKSIDTTANKRFSLSDQTEKLVKGLKQDVRITYWDRARSFANARDLLGRYQSLSPKLKIEYLDPVAKPQLARSSGVRELGLIRVDAGNGRTQEARSLTEEEVTGAIMRSLKGGERFVCFVTGTGEPKLDDSSGQGLSLLKQLAERETYKTREISLITKPEVPKDCTVTVIDRPQFDYVDQAVNAIKTYVEGGGRLLVMIGPTIEAQGQQTAEPTKLLNLMAGWGVTFNPNIILENSANAQIFGPEVPLITSYASHAIVREMTRVATAMPLSRSLTTKNADKTTVEQLFSTTSDSLEGVISGRQVRVDPKTAKKGPFTLAAAGTYNSGNPQASPGNAQGQGRFVAVGSSDWVSNGMMQQPLGNRSLIMNMLNWLSSDEELISIRPKDPEDRRLSMSTGQLRLVMYTSLLILPLLAIAAGVSVWWQRR